jgi:hypothetical protein
MMMSRAPRVIAALALIAGFATFCVVQDRVTAAGARRYVEMQRAALAGAGRPVTIDEIMRPTLTQSVWRGVEWGGAVALVGLAVAGAVGRRNS